MTIHDLAEYEILDEHRVEDVQSDGFILRHKKSGARIAILSNNDDNKVFYIGFRTPPEDETGVPHIIEHTTLCGSKKFPVKDPFIELAKGSLNTFLNAMTYPDKTVYPVASCNDQDFKNLMDVYLDAVFNPNITKYEEIFKQEGWHYELTGKDDELKINGVVYNEMKEHTHRLTRCFQARFTARFSLTIPTARIQAAIRSIFLSLRMKPIWTSITSIIIRPIHTFICMVIWMLSRDLSGWIRNI